MCFKDQKEAHLPEVVEQEQAVATLSAPLKPRRSIRRIWRLSSKRLRTRTEKLMAYARRRILRSRIRTSSSSKWKSSRSVLWTSTQSHQGRLKMNLSLIARLSNWHSCRHSSSLGRRRTPN